MSGASADALASALPSFKAGLAASLGVPASQLAVGAPSAAAAPAAGRRRSLLAAAVVPFSVSLDPAAGALGARLSSLSAAIASAASDGASPLYASLRQAGLASAAAAVAQPPALSVSYAVSVPVSASAGSGSSGSTAQVAQALTAALQPGGAVESGLAAAVGTSFGSFSPGGAAAVILPPPLPPPSPLPPPPAPRPPVAPLPPAAPAEPLGCDLQPCFPSVTWCEGSEDYSSIALLSGWLCSFPYAIAAPIVSH